MGSEVAQATKRQWAQTKMTWNDTTVKEYFKEHTHMLMQNEGIHG